MAGEPVGAGSESPGGPAPELVVPRELGASAPAAWSPDGSVLAEAIPGGVRRWHIRSQKSLPDLSLKGAFHCCWSPDGKLLMASGAGKSCIWDSASGKLVRELNGFALEWVPDGRTIAALNTQRELVFVDATTDAPQRKLLGALPALGNVYGSCRWGNQSLCGAWSLDAKSLAYGATATVSILETESSQMRVAILGHRANILQMKWSSDQAKLLAWGGGGVTGNIGNRIFDGRSGQQLRVFGTTGATTEAIGPAELSPDGTILAAGMNRVALWEVNSGNLVRVMQEDGEAHWLREWAPDGKRLAARAPSGRIKVWNTEDGSLVKTLSPSQRVEVAWLQWTPDGKTLAGRADSGPTVIWDVDSGKELGPVSGETESHAFSPDGATLALGYRTGEIRLCDTKSAQILDTFRKTQAPVVALHWCRDGNGILSGSQNGEISEWDCTTGRLLRTVSGVVPEVFSPDGRYAGAPPLLCGSLADYILRQNLGAESQGSRFAATLGYETQPLRGNPICDARMRNFRTGASG